jgi:hypothetical protein
LVEFLYWFTVRLFNNCRNRRRVKKAKREEASPPTVQEGMHVMRKRRNTV